MLSRSFSLLPILGLAVERLWSRTSSCHAVKEPSSSVALVGDRGCGFLLQKKEALLGTITMQHQNLGIFDGQRQPRDIRAQETF